MPYAGGGGGGGGGPSDYSYKSNVAGYNGQAAIAAATPSYAGPSGAPHSYGGVSGDGAATGYTGEPSRHIRCILAAHILENWLFSWPAPSVV